jgi:uncharacterized protein (TIGR02001 family)
LSAVEAMNRQMLFAAGFLVALPAAASAEEGLWNVEASLASEYISKGVGRSAGEPHLGIQVQRQLDTDTYAGVWSGSLRSPLGADAETHLYVGWRPRVGVWSLDLRPMLKVLANAREGAQTEQWEGRLDAARPVLGGRLRLRVEHAFDGYGPSEGSTWMEANFSRRLGDTGWTLSGGLGRREQEGGTDYTAWNLGAQRRLFDPVTADLRWVDTNRREGGREYRGRFVVALTAALR